MSGAALRLEDLSWRSRFGCKGPGAERWLAAGGYEVPSKPNTATVTEGTLVARLATSEFLVEAVGQPQGRVESTREQLEAPRSSPEPLRPSDVYPVARQDLVIGIDGPETNTLLRQICSVDFEPELQASTADSGPVVLTSMIGVGVVAWPRRRDTEAGITLWIDPSFTHYLWTTLLEVSRDIGVVEIIGDPVNRASE